MNNKNTRKKCELCSKLTIKTPERVVVNFFIVNLLTYFTPFSSVSTACFEQVNGSWVFCFAISDISMR